ncbi:extensin family protein [Tistrella mobilis]|uniref:Extensin-like C-terminal domain-containing protein n=1 Tax=Tistrella mobilis (strain KA081020-065) TaxID=1110502 RepID=I3THS8_TISMK|nr:extensin family protein [Tistrella mobilis]AFK52316.1 hypothetical protein TMO_0477 [Tistrella mobilis KA081020-065]
MRPARLTLLALILGLVGGGLALAGGLIRIPDRWNPFAPPVIADAPNLLTRWKIAQLKDAPDQCLAVLETAPLRFSTVPDRKTAATCGFENAVRVSGAEGLRFSSGFTASCPLMVAWSIFDRHVLQPAARRHFASRVAQVDHLGTYACRAVRGGSTPSQHATANAIDISGVVLADGTRISLARDWSGDDARKRAFLRELRDGACEAFRGVLGPDYNAAHRDHFHLDMGRWSICR